MRLFYSLFAQEKGRPAGSACIKPSLSIHTITFTSRTQKRTVGRNGLVTSHARHSPTWTSDVITLVNIHELRSSNHGVWFMRLLVSKFPKTTWLCVRWVCVAHSFQIHPSPFTVRRVRVCVVLSEASFSLIGCCVLSSGPLSNQHRCSIVI